MKYKLIYVSFGDVSVYESQILEFLNYLNQYDNDLILMQGYHNSKEKASIEKKLFRYSIPTIWVKSYPIYPFFKRKTVRNFYKALTNIENYQHSIVHVRSEYLGYIFKRMSEYYGIRIPILIDIRGIVYEELIIKSEHHTGLRRFLFEQQKKYYKSFYEYLFRYDREHIFITSVSPLINDYIKHNYPLCNYPLYFHPNIAGTSFYFSERKRKTIRKKYNIEKNQLLAICSTGSNAIWQQDHKVIQELLDMNIAVINLSKKKFNIPGCITESIPFSEMPDYLSAADIAVLWRENTFINQSASPAKFSEFAAMGLYVIHNQSVRVAVNYIKESKAGCLVGRMEDICLDSINITKLSNRKKWHELGQSAFGVETIGKSYISLYKQLLSEFSIGRDI